MHSKWIIIASGPSMSRIDMEAVKKARPDWRVMVVNSSWQLAPWADVMYAGDAQWWDAYGNDVRFEGEKYTADIHTAKSRRIHYVERVRGHGLCTEAGRVFTGGNSGYQAVNLAYHLGMREGILLGFDMHLKNGAHWHGDHKPGMLNAPASHVRVWAREFAFIATDLNVNGVLMINSTPGSALTCFPCRPLEKALDR